METAGTAGEDIFMGRTAPRVAEAKEIEKAPRSAFLQLQQEARYHLGGHDVAAGAHHVGDVYNGATVGEGATVDGDVYHGATVGDHATVDGDVYDATVGDHVTVSGDVYDATVGDHVTVGGDVYDATVGDHVTVGGDMYDIRKMGTGVCIGGDVYDAHVGKNARVMGNVGTDCYSQESFFQNGIGKTTCKGPQDTKNSVVESGAVINGDVRWAIVKSGATVKGRAICSTVESGATVNGGQIKGHCPAIGMGGRKSVLCRPDAMDAKHGPGVEHVGGETREGCGLPVLLRGSLGRAHKRDEGDNERRADKEEKDSTTITQSGNVTSTTVTEADSTARHGKGKHVKVEVATTNEASSCCEDSQPTRPNRGGAKKKKKNAAVATKKKQGAVLEKRTEDDDANNSDNHDQGCDAKKLIPLLVLGSVALGLCVGLPLIYCLGCAQGCCCCREQKRPTVSENKTEAILGGSALDPEGPIGTAGDVLDPAPATGDGPTVSPSDAGETLVPSPSDGAQTEASSEAASIKKKKKKEKQKASIASASDVSDAGESSKKKKKKKKTPPAP
eukprot:g7061.t1